MWIKQKKKYINVIRMRDLMIKSITQEAGTKQKRLIETRMLVRLSGGNVRRRLREEPYPKITSTDTIVEMLEVEAGPRQAKYISEAIFYY